MRPRASTWLLAAFVGWMPPTAAIADTGATVPVRVGNHDGYGRVVFDLPSWSDYTVTQQDQHVVVKFAAELAIGSAPAVPRNVISITGGASQAELVLAPGTALHDWRFGDRLVIDVLDRAAVADRPAAQRTAVPKAAPAKPTPGPPGAQATAPVAAPPPTQPTAPAPPPPAPKPEPQPQPDVARQPPEAGPTAAAATPAPPSRRNRRRPQPRSQRQPPPPRRPTPQRRPHPSRMTDCSCRATPNWVSRRSVAATQR